MKKGGVAQSYLDPLAVRVQSARITKEGRGWKKFLVFAELTKTWLRICFAEGPRQVINAITLYSVLQLNLVPEGDHAAKDGHTPVVQFFVNIQALADKNREQAVILFGMLFTLIVWVITAINLIIACLLYLLFLWHHVPSSDRGLKGYCRRKINGRLERIVKIKVNKALRKENQLRQRQDAQGGNDLKKQPTLPTLPSIDTSSTDKLPLISRTTTQTSLPSYTSRAGTPGSLSTSPPDAKQQPSLPDLDFGFSRPGPPSRNLTQASAMSIDSYSSDAPLIAAAGDMGYGPPGRSQTPVDFVSGRPPPSRSATGFSQSTQRSNSPFRPPTAQGRQSPNSYAMGPIPRPGTGMSGPPGSMGRRTPGPSPLQGPGRGTPGPTNSYGPPPMGGNPYGPPPGRSTPMGGPPSLRSGTPGSVNPGGYTPFNPYSNRGTPGPPENRSDYFGRPMGPSRTGTAPPNTNTGEGYEDIYDSYSEPSGPQRLPPRAATTTPGGGGGYGGPPRAGWY
ncbi:MAG: hypothetical protein Q9227_002303 [Pyrenula ochraceoflavens]